MKLTDFLLLSIPLLLIVLIVLTLRRPAPVKVVREIVEPDPLPYWALNYPNYYEWGLRNPWYGPPYWYPLGSWGGGGYSGGIRTGGGHGGGGGGHGGGGHGGGGGGGHH